MSSFNLSLLRTIITAAINGGNNHKGKGDIIPSSRSKVVIRKAINETGNKLKSRKLTEKFFLKKRKQLNKIGKQKPIGWIHSCHEPIEQIKILFDELNKSVTSI